MRILTKKEDRGLHYRSGSAYYDIILLYFSWGNIGKEVTITSSFNESVEVEFEHLYHICFPCVVFDENYNSFGPQNHLLDFYWEIVTSM